MYNGKKIVVVLPAYNAALTLEKTYQEIPFNIVDEVILSMISVKTGPWIWEETWNKTYYPSRGKQRVRWKSKTCYRRLLNWV